jgi:heptose-I-phosphate ethanolaminephosphotransferase
MTSIVTAFPVNIFHAIAEKLLPIVNVETEAAVTPVKISRQDETDQETVIYVIGESARSDHWHKNGYSRETTPFIDNEVIINFSKVRSISDCTSLSIPGLLGMLSAKQLYDLNLNGDKGSDSIKKVPGHASLFDYFRSAGFYTSAVISFNQSVLPITSVGAKLDHVEQTNEDINQYDTQMLPYFYKELEKPFKKKFIVLHIYGSHWQYENRYPPQFNKFKDSGSQFREHMAYYDNSILATDSFLHDVLDKLKSVAGKVVLVYTSDHGEGDGKKMEVHCSEPSNLTTLVPLFFWTNGKVPSDKIKQLNENTSQYVSHELIATTLLDLVGINSDNLDYSQSLTRKITPVIEHYSYGYNRKLYSCSLKECLEVH